MQKKPVNLNLFTISFPITAITSILHRISGMALCFLLVPAYYFYAKSLQDLDSFTQLTQALHNNFLFKLLLFIYVVAFLYHFLAGVKHLLHDLHIFSCVKMAKCLSWLMLIVYVVLFAMLTKFFWF